MADEKRQQQLTTMLLQRLYIEVKNFELQYEDCDGIVIHMALGAALLGELQAAQTEAPEHFVVLRRALRKVLFPVLVDGCPKVEAIRQRVAAIADDGNFQELNDLRTLLDFLGQKY